MQQGAIFHAILPAAQALADSLTTPSDGLTPSQRWYRNLKSDPERYLAWCAKQESYAKKHRRHLRAKHRKSDKKRYRTMMKDPVAHEEYLAKRRERHRIRMETDPAYREKCRAKATAAYKKIKATNAVDPEKKERFNSAARQRQKARADFLRATPEGRAVLYAQAQSAWQRIKSDPTRHEKQKMCVRESMRKARATDEYKAKKEADIQKRAQKKRRTLNQKAYYSRPEVKAHRKIYMKAFLERHPGYLEKRYRAIVEKCSIDPEFYAGLRSKNRNAARKYYAQFRKRPYKPSLSRRIPDYCVRGRVLDKASTFLRNNLSDSQMRSIDAYSRDQAIAQREWLCDNNKV